MADTQSNEANVAVSACGRFGSMPPFVSENARRHLWSSVRNTILSRRRTASWEDPDLEALLNDPLVIKVMARDGICPEDVREAFRAARIGDTH